MAANECGGYHWSQGQYVVSNCTPENSTFFIILGFTMLVLLLLLFVIVVIACVRKHRRRARALPTGAPLSSQDNEDDCVIDLAGIGEPSDDLNGRNLDNVKAVIMAGDEKATFIAHPISPTCSSPSSSGSADEEKQEGSHDVVAPSRPDEPTQQARQEGS